MKRYLYILGSMLFLILNLLLQGTYRPYIYENGIYDFHVADTIGNLCAVPCISLLLLGTRKFQSVHKAILDTILVLFLYEFTLSKTFDYYDLIATCISGGIMYAICMGCKQRKFRNYFYHRLHEFTQNNTNRLSTHYNKSR